MVRSLIAATLTACLAAAPAARGQSPDGGALVDPVGRTQAAEPPVGEAKPDAQPRRLAPPAPEEDDDGGLDPADWGRIVGLGAGIGGIVAAVLLGVGYESQDAKAEKLRKEAIDAVGPTNPCGEKSPLKDSTCKKLGEALQTRDSYGTVAIAAGVSGGLLVIASIVTLIVPLGDDDEDGTEVSFSPTPGGIVIQGRF